MRKKCTDQVSIFDLFSNHEIGKELKAMSERLDRHRELLDWVEANGGYVRGLRLRVVLTSVCLLCLSWLRRFIHPSLYVSSIPGEVSLEDTAWYQILALYLKHHLGGVRREN